MEKPGFIKRFFSFLLRICVVLVLMVAIAAASFEGVTYYLTGSFTNLADAIKEELGESSLTGSSSDTSVSDTTTSVDSKNMENVLVFVQGDEDTEIYMALNMYNKKTKALDVLLIPSNAQVSVGSSLLKEIRETMTDAGSSLNMEDVARAFGEDKYEMMTKIIEEVSGLTIEGRDVLSKSDFIKVLSLAGTVNYQLDYTISYRDEDGILQTLANGDGEDTDEDADSSEYGEDTDEDADSSEYGEDTDEDADDSEYGEDTDEDADDSEYDEDADEYDSDEESETTESGDTAALDGEMAYVLLTYLDGTDSEESNRLERCADYLEMFYDRLIAQDDAAGIAKSYNRLAESTEESELTSKKKILKNLTDDALTIRVMQGSESAGVFTLDSQKVKLQASTLIKQSDNYSADGSGSTSAESDTSETGSTASSSKGYAIELYNAAYVSGLAASWEVFLEGEGYSISLIDSYQEEGPISQTRINVTEDGMGEDLLTWFPDAEISVVDEISTGGDIQVYIGTDSTSVPESSSYGTGTTSDDDTDSDDIYTDNDTDSDNDAYTDDDNDVYTDDDTDSDDDAYTDDDTDSDDDVYTDDESDTDDDSYSFDTDSQ